MAEMRGSRDGTRKRAESKGRAKAEAREGEKEGLLPFTECLYPFKQLTTSSQLLLCSLTLPRPP